MTWIFPHIDFIRTMNHTRLVPCLTAALLATVLPSCQLLVPAPAADSGFNPRTTATANSRAAFLQQVWIADSYRGKPVSEQFSSVYIAPVSTRFMAEQSWWQQQTPMRQESLSEDTRAIATRMRQQFMAAIINNRAHKISLARAPGPGVLVIELALVELVPSKAYWNAAATAAGFAVPGAGFLSIAGRGSIAIEGRARDGATKSVIATFKDRRADKTAPVDLGKYTWYHGAEANITDWAAEFAEFLNTPPSHVVKRAKSITLKPW